MFEKATNSTRRMFVWTPPNYFADNKKLPVLYLLHGGGDNDTNWPVQGEAGWIPLAGLETDPVLMKSMITIAGEKDLKETK